VAVVVQSASNVVNVAILRENALMEMGVEEVIGIAAGVIVIVVVVVVTAGMVQIALGIDMEGVVEMEGVVVLQVMIVMAAIVLVRMTGLVVVDPDLMMIAIKE
ncbi:hypothetical protein KI387_018982, partial [Taxus chinensis]